MGEERSFLRAEHHESQLRRFVRPKSVLMPLDGAEEEVVEKAGPPENPDTGEKGLSPGEEKAGEEEEEATSQDGREEEGEEGRDAPTVRAPQRVSRQEREDHERTHAPFRAWCSHRVRGRGKNAAHREQAKDEIRHTEAR